MSRRRFGVSPCPTHLAAEDDRRLCLRKLQRLEEAVKKGQKKLSNAMKGLDTLEADHEEMGDALVQAATAIGW